MVEVNIGQHNWKIDNLLNQKLQKVKDTLRKDDNYTILIDGPTGAGKTTLAVQIAKIVDPNFSVDKMYYDGNLYIDGCLKVPKYSAVIYDEAYRDWSSTRVMTSMSHRLNAMMMEIRQRNLCHIIVLPSFFDLNKTMAIFGSDTLIHVSKRNDGARNFRYFDSSLKKYLYIKGKKFYNYMSQKPLFKGTFGRHMPVNNEKYLEKKAKMLQKLNETQTKPMGMMAKKQMTERDGCINMLREKYGAKYTEIAEHINKLTGLGVDGIVIGKYNRDFLEKIENHQRLQRERKEEGHEGAE